MTGPAPAGHHHERMTGRAWALFAAMGVIWGIPYLFIKIAVGELSPGAVVGLRTAIGALVLLPLALPGGALRVAWRYAPWVATFAVLEMALPWLLLTSAEQRVPSGFAGLMLATVPIVGTVVMALLGDRRALAPVRLAGLAAGLLGVGLLVGLDIAGGQVDLVSVLELLGCAVGYAVAPVVADRRLRDVPSLGVIAGSLALVAVLYAPASYAGLAGGLPSAKVVGSVLVLGLVCTALAFVLFFALIAAVGPVRATVITFVNPAVAVLAGLVVLGEPLTMGILVGFPLVLLGSVLATRGGGRT